MLSSEKNLPSMANLMELIAYLYVGAKFLHLKLFNT
jgi:hypothetical protein